jgi:GTPase
VREVLRAVATALATAPEPQALEEDLPVLRPAPDEEQFEIKRLAPGSYRVTGGRIERAARRTDWDNDDAVARFHRIVRATGIEQALLDEGVSEGDTVFIGDIVELEWD